MGTETQTLANKVKTVRSWFESAEFTQAIKNALPKHLTPERMIRVFVTACTANPKLLDCTQESLVSAMMQSSQLGLEVNGVLGHGYLVPYKNVATFLPGYKGLMDLARRSGKVTRIFAYTVHENDRFKVSMGLHPDLKHELPKQGVRGKAIGYYAVGHVKGADPEFRYWTHEECLAHRNKFSHKPQKGKWTWEEHEEAMCLKTVVKALCKWLPQTVELAAALETDSAGEKGEVLTVTDGMIDVTDSMDDSPPEPTVSEKLAAKRAAAEGRPKIPATEEEKKEALLSELNEILDDKIIPPLEFDALVEKINSDASGAQDLDSAELWQLIVAVKAA